MINEKYIQTFESKSLKILELEQDSLISKIDKNLNNKELIEKLSFISDLIAIKTK